MRVRLDRFTKRFGDVTVIENLTLDINSGEMLALLGPSGCGKSTTLFAICGIHRMNSGKLLFGEKNVTTLPSQKRNVGVVFQNYALYPHMNVYDNIAFPLRVRKDKASAVDQQVRDVAELVHVPELLKRKPAQLSGGQQQRVALARALVRRPDILLLDEPLANLDTKLRLEMRSEIRRIQLETGITAVLVTHDQVEAMSMCDRIAIMKEGHIVQLSEPDEMYRNPVSEFVAGFLGNPPISMVDAQVVDDAIQLKGTATTLNLAPVGVRLKNGDALRLGIRPEHFRPEFPDKIPGKITFIEKQGRERLYDVTLPNGTVLRSIQDRDNPVSLGDDVNWGVLVDQVLAFDLTGNRL